MNVGSPERRLYAAAFLYTAVGGYLDAYSYTTHAHVFANAQTGNIVLLGIELAHRNPTDALTHLPPILTFIAGVLGVLWVKERRDLSAAQLRTIGACIELTVLILLFAIGKHTPNALVVPSIAFVAAVQVTSFGSVSEWNFNSAMTTGNLRDTLKAFVLWRAGKNSAQNRKTFLATGTVCLCFAFGALLGGVCSRLFPGQALLPAIAGIAAAILCPQRLRNPSEQS